MNETKYSEEWTLVIEKSVEECHSLSEKHLATFNYLFNILLSVPASTPTTSECQKTEPIARFLWCVMQMSFLSCPVSSVENQSSTDCEKIKKFVETPDKCATKYGEISIIEYKFWYTSGNDRATTATQDAKEGEH